MEKSRYKKKKEQRMLVRNQNRWFSLLRFTSAASTSFSSSSFAAFNIIIDDDGKKDVNTRRRRSLRRRDDEIVKMISRGFAASSSSSEKMKNKINPYIALARLDKPIGIYLLAYPCLWSILLSSSTAAIPPATEEIAAMTALFSAGAVLLRGAGCTVNDIWDRKVDAKVERTKDRPIASGKITVPNAVAFLGAQLGLGSVVLYQLDFNTQILGLMSLPLVVAYPLMKRVTNLPQLFLGFTLNWGALMGWTAITGGVLEAPALALYGSGVCWTMVYDTIYAHQDIDDDKKIGVKSSARLFESNTKGILSTFGIGAISGLIASGYLADAHWAFYPFLLSTAGTHLFWQIYTVDLKNRKDCGDKFRSNQTYGGLVLSSILAAKVAENVL
jgi:4-hydroxybenzoate polyprenyltransferase